MDIYWLAIPVAYLLGSLSSAVLVCRAMGLPDPRSEGSKNPGATNVLRLGGKGPAALTLAGDLLKGLLPVLLLKVMDADPMNQGAAGFAAFIGHLYPVFFGFLGGKGVATALGIYLGLHWMLGGAVIGTWLVMALLFRYSSLAALIATLLAPLYAGLITGSTPLVIATAAMTGFIFWRHKLNIQRLLKGEEDKIGKKKAKPPAA
jgi:glycerol-3-phosphate acyltransferase PlsY